MSAADRVVGHSVILDDFEAPATWTALSNDTTTVAASTSHVTGKSAVSYAKVNGAANTIFGGMSKTREIVSLVAPGRAGADPSDLLQICIYLSSLANVAYVFLRLGTSATHYSEWRCPVANITAAVFNRIVWSLADVEPTVVGQGCDTEAVQYMAVGTAHNAESDALAGIVVDSLTFVTRLLTAE